MTASASSEDATYLEEARFEEIAAGQGRSLRQAMALGLRAT
jgi:hypothetical protein